MWEYPCVWLLVNFFVEPGAPKRRSISMRLRPVVLRTPNGGENVTMKTFIFGLLIAAVVALLAGIGLQWVDIPSATAYSTNNVQLSTN
jgi:hypothetical protein